MDSNSSLIQGRRGAFIPSCNASIVGTISVSMKKRVASSNSSTLKSLIFPLSLLNGTRAWGAEVLDQLGPQRRE